MSNTDTDTNAQPPGKPDGVGKVPFKVDGQNFTTGEPKQPARDVLALAGLSADDYDLTRPSGPGQVETFDDDDIVHIRPGDKFLSLKQSATVA